MTVATGAAGTTIVGATLGAGFLDVGSVSTVGDVLSAGRGATEAIQTLPFTGANHILVLFALGLLALLAGALMLGLARRHSGSLSAPPV